MQKLLSLLFIILMISCTDNPEEKTEKSESKRKVETAEASVKYELSIEPKNLFSDSLVKISHFRGLQISREGMVMISGSNNMILQYNFHGKKYYENRFKSSEKMEFRDIQINKYRYFAMSIQSPSKIVEHCNQDPMEPCYIMEGPMQRSNFSHPDTLCFLDGMDFWNDSVGIVFGDPLDEYPFVLKTIDGGTSWNRISEESLPKSLEMEAGFAASGTSIVCVGEGIGYIGLGGEQARIFKTTDYGDTWKAYNTCMLQGEAGKGIYSMAFKDELNGVAVGGNWENTSCIDSKIFTIDGGLTWQKGTGIQEYRSCVTHWKEGIYISTGTSGTDISYDNGANWQVLDTLGFNSIAFMESGIGIGVGNRGLIRKLSLQKIKQ